jgi:hypothetical protein
VRVLQVVRTYAAATHYSFDNQDFEMLQRATSERVSSDIKLNNEHLHYYTSISY